jgi:hypothetical protein
MLQILGEAAKPLDSLSLHKEFNLARLRRRGYDVLNRGCEDLLRKKCLISINPAVCIWHSPFGPAVPALNLGA